MRRTLTLDEFSELLAGYKQSAFRLEQQRQYLISYEQESLAQFLAGTPQAPEEMPGFTEWTEQIKRQTAAGKQMMRVRIQEEPPTDYQRWENWIATWNMAAGELMRRMSRQRAHEVGLLPAAGKDDFWLLDEQSLIVMSFDRDGTPGTYELVDDPEAIKQACWWRNLAVLHSKPDNPGVPPTHSPAIVRQESM